MMKYKYVALLVGLICSAFYPTFVSAETRYVSDQLETTLRRGPTLGHAILRMLKSGTALEVLEHDAENGHTRVKTSAGLEGWVLSRYLMTEPDARTQVDKMAKQISSAVTQEGSVRAQLNAMKDEYEGTKKRLLTLEGENKRLTEQLDSIRKTSANAIAIDKENKKLQDKLSITEERFNGLQQRNSELEDHRQKDWFFAGALVLLGGVALGLILPLLTRKKRSRYGSFE